MKCVIMRVQLSRAHNAAHMCSITPTIGERICVRLSLPFCSPLPRPRLSRLRTPCPAPRSTLATSPTPTATNAHCDSMGNYRRHAIRVRAIYLITRGIGHTTTKCARRQHGVVAGDYPHCRQVPITSHNGRSVCPPRDEIDGETAGEHTINTPLPFLFIGAPCEQLDVETTYRCTA